MALLGIQESSDELDDGLGLDIPSILVAFLEIIEQSLLFHLPFEQALQVVLRQDGLFVQIPLLEVAHKLTSVLGIVVQELDELCYALVFVFELHFHPLVRVVLLNTQQERALLRFKLLLVALASVSSEMQDILDGSHVE